MMKAMHRGTNLANIVQTGSMKLLIALLIPLAVGFTGSYFTMPEIQGWYSTLNKPWFQPPNWLFGPVWTSLYILMGIAMYLIWKQPDSTPGKKGALYIYAVQLVFNFFWSMIFFRFHALGFAMGWIVVLWLLILLTIFRFGKISSTAAWLLVPYISWVSFASILNFTIWQLN